MRVEISEKQKYLEMLSGHESALMKEAKEQSRLLNKDGISISSHEAALVQFMVKSFGCKKFVEIGTLTGYSALAIMDAMGDQGEIWTLEKDVAHAEAAKKIFAQDPRASRIHLLVGDARETLQTLASHGPFDGIFIDGNKAAYLDYLLWAEANLKSGALVLGDNVFLSGAVWGETTSQKFSEKQVRIMREFNERLANPELYQSCLIPTDEGLFVAIKK